MVITAAKVLAKGLARKFDLDIKRYVGEYGPDVYRNLFPEYSLATKAFVNIGAGDWRHPLWTNVDYFNKYYSYNAKLIDINWDIALLTRLVLKDESVELVYSSHTIEHLLQRHVDFMLSELARILKPGGVARITTPNIRLYYEAYKRRDIYFNHHYQSRFPFGTDGTFSSDRLSIWLVNEFATQLVQSAKQGHVPRFTDAQEVDSIFGRYAIMEQGLDHFTAMVDFDLQRHAVGHHVSWWTSEKLCSAMRRAGFSETIVSIRGGSVSPVMRDLRYFDNVIPTC